MVETTEVLGMDSGDSPTWESRVKITKGKCFLLVKVTLGRLEAWDNEEETEKYSLD